MHGGAHASTAIGWAGGDVTEMLVVGELGLRLNLGSGDGESLEDLTDVRALLHRDDTELILLIDPDEECLGVVVEDATSLGPFTLESAGLKVLITTLEKEMVCNKLLTVGIRHGGKGVVLALQLASEGAESRHNLLLDFATLLGSDGGAKWVIGEVTGHADSSRVDHSVLIGGEVRALQLGVVHVADVLVCWGVLVIILDDLVEKGSKGVEALVAACVHTNAGVGPFATGEDALLEGEAKLVLSVLAGVPHVACENLGEERFGAAWEEGELVDLRGENEV